jgi:lipopolysaccharide biosynthesis glycosyltransferase
MTVNNVLEPLRQFARNLGFGVTFYRLYHIPKSFLGKCFRIGLINIMIDNRARLQMEAAAYHLEPIQEYATSKPLEIHFLTGKKFWYQTCFCAYSMAQQSKVNLIPVVYDDGTLEKKYVEQIKRIFPGAKIISIQEIEQRLDKFLPISKFPYIRERRANYPNMRKLIDIHIASNGWKLVLDSDMLFFDTPTFLLNWLESPQDCCYMVDVETSYGYSEALMTSLAQAEIPKRINVGICGLKSEDINWEQLESWCKQMIEQEGTHYYQEQAITAMLMAGKPCAIAPEKEYIVMPIQGEVINPKAVLHHYVSDSKPWYFRYAWKHILQNNI